MHAHDGPSHNLSFPWPRPLEQMVDMVSGVPDDGLAWHEFG